MGVGGHRVVVVVLASTLAASVAAVILFTATNAYSFELVYAELPADDSALANWLRSQPGVQEVTVSRRGDTVLLGFTMPSLGGHPQPDVVGQAGRLAGYRGFKGFSSSVKFRLW